jgi:hypothetical protein
MADLRALEEQAERANPIAPSTKRKAVKGGSATPSMGLSQHRGGRTRKMPSLKAELAKETPSLHNAMFDEMALMPTGEYDGAGKHTLMDHLAAPMKGFGDYLHAFEGDVAPAVAKAKKILPGATRKGGMDTGRYQGEGRFVDPSVRKVKRAMADGRAKEVGALLAESNPLAPVGIADFRGGMAMGQVVGSGKLTITHGDESDEEMEGGAPRLMMCDDPAPAAAAAPAGRKKRAPAGPDDGRRKRAAVVKRVMAERGLSMIEASKYVKEHNLYPGGARPGAASAVASRAAAAARRAPAALLPPPSPMNPAAARRAAALAMRESF